jgi:hypothetical protein
MVERPARRVIADDEGAHGRSFCASLREALLLRESEINNYQPDPVGDPPSGEVGSLGYRPRGSQKILLTSY